MIGKRRKCYGCGKRRVIYDCLWLDDLRTVCKKCSHVMQLDTRAKFRRLADEFYRDTMHLSTNSHKHPAYREIVEMGMEVVPHLLKETEKCPGPWFVALQEITREKPFSSEHEGKVGLIAKLWIEWGKDKGMI